MNYTKRFRIEPGSKVDLNDIDPGFHGDHASHAEAAAELQNHLQRITKLQRALYADRSHSLLIVLAKPTQPPVEGPLPTDQINLTDEELRIMPVSGGGFEQCYNAQAVVAEGSLLVVAGDVVQSPNDKQQLEPMLAKTSALPEELGKVETLLGDNGYFSEANVKACKGGRDRAVARHGPGLPSSILERALRRGSGRARKSNAGRGHGPPPANVRRQETLRPAQTHSRAGVRHHQVRARIPSVSAARAGQSQRRVESRDCGLENEADVRAEGCMKARR